MYAYEIGVETQFVGPARTVAGPLQRLQRLQEATGADELLVTTLTHASCRPGHRSVRTRWSRSS